MTQSSVELVSLETASCDILLPMNTVQDRIYLSPGEILALSDDLLQNFAAAEGPLRLLRAERLFRPERQAPAADAHTNWSCLRLRAWEEMARETPPTPPTEIPAIVFPGIASLTMIPLSDLLPCPPSIAHLAAFGIQFFRFNGRRLQVLVKPDKLFQGAIRAQTVTG